MRFYFLNRLTTVSFGEYNTECTRRPLSNFTRWYKQQPDSMGKVLKSHSLVSYCIGTGHSFRTCQWASPLAVFGGVSVSNLVTTETWDLFFTQHFFFFLLKVCQINTWSLAEAPWGTMKKFPWKYGCETERKGRASTISIRGRKLAF